MCLTVNLSVKALSEWPAGEEWEKDLVQQVRYFLDAIPSLAPSTPRLLQMVSDGPNQLCIYHSTKISFWIREAKENPSGVLRPLGGYPPTPLAEFFVNKKF